MHPPPRVVRGLSADSAANCALLISDAQFTNNFGRSGSRLSGDSHSFR